MGADQSKQPNMEGSSSNLPFLSFRRSNSVGRHANGVPSPPIPSVISNMSSPAPPPMISLQKAVSTPVPSLSSVDSYDNLNYSEDHVESLDLQGVEWEGYAYKKGHLVRNWKLRYFTLEGIVLSYYESKEDARHRRYLKGRVTITHVTIDTGSTKHDKGYDFLFKTVEEKTFHISCTTDLDRRVWVHMMEVRKT